jgi:hypothetical protein
METGDGKRWACCRNWAWRLPLLATSDFRWERGAIALSEAREAGAKPPRKGSASGH